MEIHGRYGSATFDLPSQIVGGYSCQSWSCSGSYTSTPNPAERTAFLFNLSSSSIQRQNWDATGVFETVCDPGFGPSFSGGWDLLVRASLTDGSANNYSYGGTHGAEIVYGGPDSFDTYSFFIVGEVEVHSIGLANTSGVPDVGSTNVMLAVSLA